jgi:hypothetical protein
MIDERASDTGQLEKMGAGKLQTPKSLALVLCAK